MTEFHMIMLTFSFSLNHLKLWKEILGFNNFNLSSTFVLLWHSIIVDEFFIQTDSFIPSKKKEWVGLIDSLITVFPYNNNKKKKPQNSFIIVSFGGCIFFLRNNLCALTFPTLMCSLMLLAPVHSCVSNITFKWLLLSQIFSLASLQFMTSLKHHL